MRTRRGPFRVVIRKIRSSAFKLFCVLRGFLQQRTNLFFAGVIAGTAHDLQQFSVLRMDGAAPFEHGLIDCQHGSISGSERISVQTALEVEEGNGGFRPEVISAKQASRAGAIRPKANAEVKDRFAACFLGELFHPVLPADDAASNAPAEYDEVCIPEESRCGFFEGQDICSERFGNPLRIPAGIAGMGFV